MDTNTIVIRRNRTKTPSLGKLIVMTAAMILLTILVATPLLIVSATCILFGMFNESLMSAFLLAVTWVPPIVIPLIVIFLSGTIVAAAICDVPRVEIGPNGFVFHQLTRRRTRQWHDIEGEFTVGDLRRLRVVVYHLSEAFKKSKKYLAKPKPHTDQEQLLGNFELAADELAALLNEQKRRAAEGNSQDSE